MNETEQTRSSTKCRIKKSLISYGLSGRDEVWFVPIAPCAGDAISDAGLRRGRYARLKESKVYRYSSIAYVIDAIARGQMTLLNPSSWADRNDSFYIDLYKQYREVAAVFASCCTLSKETFHHWYVFGGSSAGAFIEYDRARLEASFETLKAQGHKLRFEKVSYMTLENVEGPQATLDRLPFLKRWGFESEKEYRVIAETDEEEMIAYPLSVSNGAIRRVVINPWLPRSVVDSITARIQAMEGCEKLKVDHSRLIESDRWKTAGIRKLTGHRRRNDPAFQKFRRKPSRKKSRQT